MEGEGKGDGRQHRLGYWAGSGILGYRLCWRPSPSEEVRGHWTPTGTEPMDQWMDGFISNRLLARTA